MIMHIIILFCSVFCVRHVVGDRGPASTMSIYMARMVQKNNDSVGLKHCVMGSTSKFLNIPKNLSDVRYYGNLINYLNENLCSKIPTEVGPEGVLFTQVSRHCNVSRIIQHVRIAKNIKILVMLSDYIHRVPEKVATSNSDPTFVILDKHVFMDTVQPEKLNTYKFGIYRNKFLQSKNPQILTCVCMGLVLVLTMVLLCSLTVLYNDELMKISLLISKTKKTIFYIIAGLLFLGATTLFVLHNYSYVWINIILFLVVGTHALAFTLTLVLQTRNWFQKITLSVDKIGLTSEDFKFWTVFILCSTVPIVWILHRNNPMGNVLNVVIGIFICNELALVLGMMLASHRGSKMMAFYVFIIFIYSISPLLIILAAKVVDVLFVKVLSRSKPNMVYCNEDFPFKFRIPLTVFENILTDCDILYKNQYLIHHYADIIISGSINVYLLLFLTSRKLFKLVHFFSLIGGFSVGVFFYFMVCVFFGRFLPATLLIIICALIPVSVILGQNHQFSNMIKNKWIKTTSNEDSELKAGVPPTGDAVKDC